MRSNDVMEYTKALENQIRELEADAKLRVQHQMELEMQLMEKEDELQALPRSTNDGLAVT